MVFGTAVMVEENVAAFRRANRVGSPTTRPLINMPTSPEKKAIVPVQYLSPLQIKEHPDKGVCYNCDDKWGPGHRCKAARLFIMECNDSNEEEEPQVIDTLDLLEGARSSPSRQSTTYIDTTSKISIHALLRSPSPKTMRILGHIGSCAMVILVDIGSTHNFMDHFVLSKAHLHPQPTADLA
ncbi:hypothetical protein I3842_16G098000, partial [Carya illinoinensis]